MSLYFISQMNLDAEDEHLVKSELTTIKKGNLHSYTKQQELSARYLSYVIMVQFFQSFLIFTILSFLIQQLVTTVTTTEDLASTNLVRLIMGTVMHVSLVDTSRTGLAMMKFSMKHSERLQSPYICFWIGFLKFAIVVFIEFCNCLYMCYLTDIIQITYAYIKLYSISSLDKLTFLVLESGDPFAHMIDSGPEHQP